MKFTRRLVFAFLTLAAAVSLQAEPPRVEHVIDLLQKAKEADSPLSLLQKAHNEFKGFNPVDETQMTANGSGPRVIASMQVAGRERKGKAMEAIGQAIEAAKTGGETKAKIESAIAKVHFAGSLKR